MNTLAILGGTFDPFHRGHLYLAQAAVKFFSCPLRLIPNGWPPHRQAPKADWRHRLAMCRLAAADDAAIQVGEEETPQQPRYTVQTLATLKQQYPQTTLLLILGSDAYAAWESWAQPQTVLKLAHLVVVQRAAAALSSLPWGSAVEDKSELSRGSGKVYVWHCTPPPFSAAACRAKLAAGEAVDDELPPAVLDYIRTHRLYLG